MKKITLLFALFLSFSAYATIRTVSNVPATLAQFNTIQAAVDASISGDTIYVHGSPNAYTAFTITNKQLVIIGPGWAPNKNLPHIAMVPGLTITGVASGNTEIQGLFINSTVIINSTSPDNLRFVRNQFVNMSIAINEGVVTYSGYLFEGNVFENAQIAGVTNSTYQNFLIQNNLFFENGTVLGGNVTGFQNSVNVLFDHNLWYGPGAGTRDCFAANCRFLTITNNIFVNRHPANQNSQSTFNNNITFNAGDNTPWNSNANIDAGGNVANQDPQMVAQTSVNTGAFGPLLNFTIAAGPANNSGSDLKDMGLLYDAVGSLNWTNSRGSRLPFIFSMNITNPTLPSGGNLNVIVEARKNN